MHLIQIVLPLYDNDGALVPRERFTVTLKELTDAFGGATAFTRSPAEGFWETPRGGVQREDVVVVEAMADALDEGWWHAYKGTLEARFAQETILIRALPCLTI